MKCADALFLMLDADLAALSADHASPLGEHVQGCARCRAVVVTLRADTSRLATLAVARPAPVVRTQRTNRRRAIWLAPLPLAAAAVLAFVVQSRVPSSVVSPAATSVRAAAAPHPLATPDPAVSVPTAPVASRIVNRSALEATRLHTPEGAADVPEGRRSTPTRIDVGGPTLARAVAPTPVAYAVALTGADMASVDVSTAGGRVVVLRPSNSNITVVWFY